jgi:hypothetical protein
MKISKLQFGTCIKLSIMMSILLINNSRIILLLLKKKKKKNSNYFALMRLRKCLGYYSVYYNLFTNSRDSHVSVTYCLLKKLIKQQILIGKFDYLVADMVSDTWIAISVYKKLVVKAVILVTAQPTLSKIKPFFLFLF